MKKTERLINLMTLSSIDGIGAKRIYQLIEHFGSAEEILRASVHDLSSVPGIGRETASLIHENQDRNKAENLVEKIEKLHWGYFLYDDPGYPSPLKQILDRPPYLFYRGSYNEKDLNAVAIVGSREASEEGRFFAEKLAGELAKNEVTVVSGMARGTDMASHRGALNAGGRTIAVFGSSLDVIYPPEGRSMAEKIIESGCIFSEYPPDTKPYGPNFPKRNRIIAGLSQGVVVIEAAMRSGALSTANHALAQNREVFAVPGSPRVDTSTGTNNLIKEGARLLTSVEDIFSELPRLKGRVKAVKVKENDNLTETEKNILNLFEADPVHIDSISRSLNKPVSELMEILLALELKGIIKELSGKRFILN